MTVPEAPQSDSSRLGAGPSTPTRPPRLAIWVALGGLVAATVVGVVMVLVGTADGIAPRALLTVLLIAAFTGVIFLDTSLAPRRPAWFVLTSMAVWVATLLIGAVMVWMPQPPLPVGLYGDEPWGGASRVVSFLLIVLVLQLAVLYVRLFVKGWRRRPTLLTNIIARTTIVMTGLLVVMLVFPLMLGGWVVFHDIYWRLMVAIGILAAVGTALVPLVMALLAPHDVPRGRASYGPAAAPVPPAWPTHPDGVTPLPMGPDGQPVWGAAPAYGGARAGGAGIPPASTAASAPALPYAPPDPSAAVAILAGPPPTALPAATPPTATPPGAERAWAPPVSTPNIAPPTVAPPTAPSPPATPAPASASPVDPAARPDDAVGPGGEEGNA